MWMAVVMI
jgi:hypothetical protein